MNGVNLNCFESAEGFRKSFDDQFDPNEVRVLEVDAEEGVLDRYEGYQKLREVSQTIQCEFTSVLAKNCGNMKFRVMANKQTADISECVYNALEIIRVAVWTSVKESKKTVCIGWVDTPDYHEFINNMVSKTLQTNVFHHDPVKYPVIYAGKEGIDRKSAIKLNNWDAMHIAAFEYIFKPKVTQLIKSTGMHVQDIVCPDRAIHLDYGKSSKGIKAMLLSW